MFYKSYGLGLIGWIISIPFILIGLIIFAFILCGANKAYWDHKITKMCENDGGVTVYEEVSLDREEYKQYINKFGKLSIPKNNKASANLNYIRFDNREFIHRNYPTVRRYEFLVKRRSDNKILGRRVSYSRVGGDFPTIIGHPTIFRCPEKTESLFNAVLKIE